MKHWIWSVFLLMGVNSFGQNNGTTKVSENDIGLILQTGNNKSWCQSYHGAKMADENYSDKRFESNPSPGTIFECQPAIGVGHAEGNLSLMLSNDSTFSGEYLMHIGIEVSKTNQDPLTSVVLEITAIN